MFEGITRFTKRLVNKATYDPELDKALLAEKQEQQKERASFRAILTKAEQFLEKAYLEKRITAIAYTEVKTSIKDNYKWLDANQEATALEIKDKVERFMTDFSRSMLADKPRQFFSNTLVLFDTTFNLLYSQNKISEEVLTKAKTDIEKEHAFLKKNPNENLDSYISHLNAFIMKYDNQKALLEKDKEIATQIQNSEVPITLDSSPSQTSVKPKINSTDINKTNQKSELVVKNKQTVEDSQFNVGQLLSDIATYSIYAILGTLLVCLIVYCGTLASNYTIVRPLNMRILFFIFGMIFWIFVGPYFLFQKYILGKELFYNSGAYLIPLYEYNPKEIQKDGFERLVWFPTTDALLKARSEYQASLEKMIQDWS